MEKVRMAVIGLQHGLEHVHAILKNERMELTAICDCSEDKLNKILLTIKSSSEIYANKIRMFSDYKELLAWDGCDAVVIATPVVLHKDMAIKGIQAGKHVFLEKPITPALEEAVELVDACRKANIVFQVGYLKSTEFLVVKKWSLCRLT